MGANYVTPETSLPYGNMVLKGHSIAPPLCREVQAFWTADEKISNSANPNAHHDAKGKYQL